MELSSRFLWILSCSLRCLVECSLNFVGHLWILHELYLWIRCEFLLQLYSQSFLFSLKFSLSCLQAFEALSRSLKFPSKFYLPFSDLTLLIQVFLEILSLTSLRILFEILLSKFCWILVRFSLNSLGVLYQILITFTWFSSFSLVVLWATCWPDFRFFWECPFTSLCVLFKCLLSVLHIIFGFCWSAAAQGHLFSHGLGLLLEFW